MQKKIQSSEWVLRNGELHVVDATGACRPDKILWRVGAIKPGAKHKTALELIQLSGVPCVNAASVLLRGYDRLSMLNVLRECNLPTIPFNVVTSSVHLKNVELDHPFVLKAGNYHGGFGKVLVENAAQWQDIKDLLFITEDYLTVEPFIRYERDIRYLAIGDKMWAMSRRGKFWKANVETTAFASMPLDDRLAEQTRQLQHYLNADILAIDILEEADGTRYFVEYNDIPGVSGFPVEARQQLANCITR